MGFVRKDGYTQISTGFHPTEFEIDVEEANELRNIVAWDFFDQVNARTPHVDDISDKTLFSKAFHDTAPDAVSLSPGIFGGVILKHLDAVSWRMIIMQSRIQRARYNNAAQRIETKLQLEVSNNVLIEATRRVKIVRGIGELTVAAIEKQMEEDTEDGQVRMVRRAFDCQMGREDCENAIDFLDNLAKRALV